MSGDSGKSPGRNNYIGFGLCFGLALGITIGSLALGLCLGLAFGAALDRREQTGDA